MRVQGFESPQSINVRDTWVETSRGQLFARIWASHGDGAELRGAIPIVLFHDSLGSVELWRSFPENLCRATGLPVVAYDRLGFGKSDPFRGEWTTKFIHEETKTFFPLLREQLGIENFVAMGHSVGGAMAALCAATESSACRALVTESAQAFVENQTIQGLLEAKEAFQQAGQLSRLEKYHGAKARWVLNAWLETWLSPDFQSWNLDEDLRGIACPTLIIHGEEDEYGSVHHPMRIAKAIAGETRVAIMPGLRHVPHREAEREIITLIRDFLDRAIGWSPTPGIG